VSALLEGGKPVAYGAKAIPEGGYWAVPKLSADACCCAATPPPPERRRLKGIHLAMKSGMLARDAVRVPARRDFSAARLAGYEKRFETSWRARSCGGAHLPPVVRARPVDRHAERGAAMVLGGRDAGSATAS